MKTRIFVALALICLAALSCRTLAPASTVVVSPASLIAPSATLVLPTETAIADATRQGPAAMSTFPAETPAPGADSLNDPYYPQMGNGGYDALHYSIDLTVDVVNNKIKGSSTMDAQAAQMLSSFNLDLHGLEVADVTVDGRPATFSRKKDELIVTPSTPLPNGSKFSVTVDYSGRPQPVDDPSAGGDTVGWFGEVGIFVLSESAGAMDWYPVDNHPLDKATYTIRITAPKQYEQAASGILESQTEDGDQKTTVWQMTHPMASYLASVVIGKYELKTGTGPGGIPLHYYFPIGAGRSLTGGFDQTSEMISYYSQVFGPYPFDSYGVVVVPEELGTAMENQSLSLFGNDMTDEITAAHELAHQWFGDSVSLKSWKDIWLNEGFATYAEALWVEHTKGKAAGDGYMRDLYTQVVSGSMTSPEDPTVGRLFDDPVYVRGAIVLYVLRMKIGDAIFFKILQGYYAKHRDSNASTDDFIAVAEQVSGQDLKSFFDDWLFAKSVPPLPLSGK